MKAIRLFVQEVMNKTGSEPIGSNCSSSSAVAYCEAANELRRDVRSIWL